jgi:hypothetical protein
VPYVPDLIQAIQYCKACGYHQAVHEPGIPAGKALDGGRLGIGYQHLVEYSQYFGGVVLFQFGFLFLGGFFSKVGFILFTPWFKAEQVLQNRIHEGSRIKLRIFGKAEVWRKEFHALLGTSENQHNIVISISYVQKNTNCCKG